MTDRIQLIYTTLPGLEQARVLAATLLDAQLIACANILPGLRSLYRWQGEICDEAEVLLLVKTDASRADKCRQMLAQRHPYEVPAIVSLPPAEANRDFAAWVAAAGNEPESPA